MVRVILAAIGHDPAEPCQVGWVYGRAMIRYALVLVALVACTSSSLPAGAACSGSGADCDDGLSCLQFGEFVGSACSVVGDMCTKTCGSNGDCASLGSNFMCFASCGGTMICGAALAQPGG
jgi:hypothetical protein